jgi:hypothetical protein
MAPDELENDSSAGCHGQVPMDMTVLRSGPPVPLLLSSVFANPPGSLGQPRVALGATYMKQEVNRQSPRTLPFLFDS